MKNYPKITLTHWEAQAGAIVGVQRYLYNVYEETTKRNWVGNPNWNPWKNDIEAACAEMAYAKYRRRYWDFSVYGKKERHLLKAGDVGHEQVRWTDLEDGSLIIRTDDDPENYFVLVIGMVPDFYMIGYIKGSDGLKDEYIRGPHGGVRSWFVPQSALTGFVRANEQTSNNSQ